MSDETDYHSPYMVTLTGRLFCYGCEWTFECVGDAAIDSWNEHHGATK